jgi:anti-sigma factor RsiW
MTELDESALWQRWRRAEAGGPEDFMALAAYADGRASDADIAAAERQIGADPDIAADLTAGAEMAAFDVADASLARVVARAEALVERRSATIVPFRGSAARPVRRWAEWTALAASVALAAWLGFALGTDTFASLDSSNVTLNSDVRDVFDPPSSFFGSFVDQGTT